MTLLPSVTNCESAKGVPVTVTGVAQVKIMTENDDYLSTACEQFLGKSKQEIQDLLLETFEGHLRAIVGTMEVEELFQDRETFIQEQECSKNAMDKKYQVDTSIADFE